MATFLRHHSIRVILNSIIILLSLLLLLLLLLLFIITITRLLFISDDDVIFVTLNKYQKIIIFISIIHTICFLYVAADICAIAKQGYLS